MNRDGLLQDRAKRRKYGLPAELRPPKLEDVVGDSAATISATRLGRRRHHRLDRWPTRRRSRRATRCRDTIGGRAAHRALRLDRADPHLLLDPVGALCREAPRPSTAIDLAGLLRPAARVERRPHARRDAALAATITRPISAPISSIRRGSSNSRATPASPRRSPTRCPIRKRSASSPTTRDPDKIDYVTYVTAHELAHQ